MIEGAVAVLGSYYGKPSKTVNLKSVSCLGTESNLNECTKSGLSLINGKAALLTQEVAGVDCIYDVPTQPSCVEYRPIGT